MCASSNSLTVKPSGDRKPLKRHRDHAGHVRTRLRHRRALFQPRDCGVVELPEAGLAAVEANRKDERRLLVEEPEAIGQHADDLTRAAVEQDAAPDHRRVPAELLPPVRVGQDDGFRAPRSVVVPGEEASEDGLDAEHRQDAVGHVDRPNLLRVAKTRDADRVAGPHADVPEAAAFVAINEIEKRRRPDVVDVDAGRRVIDDHELVGLRKWQRPQQHALDHAEDCRVRANTDGQRRHDEEREHRRTDQPPEKRGECHRSSIR